MLSVQPKISNNYNSVFTARRELNPEEFDERKYLETRRELISQQDDLQNLLDDDEIKMPKIVQQALKAGAITTTAILGGMASGWGTKKSIEACHKIVKSAPIQSFKKEMKAINEFSKDTQKIFSKKFKESDAYKMPMNEITKLEKTKIGGKIINFFKSIGNGISKIYNTVKTGVKYVYNKIRGVKQKTYEKALVNFVGASGAVAAGITTLKEREQKG